MATKKKRKPKKSNVPFTGDNLPPELIDQLLAGRSSEDITGPDGLLQQLTGALVGRLLESELTEHLDYESGEAPPEHQSNRRNGHRKKTVRTKHGEVDIRVPRDREGSFTPQLIKPHERQFDGFDDKIISMYGLGMTTRDIQKHLAELYDVDVSADFVSRATEAVLDELKEWRKRPLEEVYPVVWVDALRVNSRESGYVQKRAVYLVMGLNCAGERSVLGMWMEKTEGASFWAKVFADMQKRGVKDILFLCADGLKGMSKAVESIFPQSTFQTCVVHLIRSSTVFLPYDQRKQACRDLKKIYTAVDEDAAEDELAAFEEKWAAYPAVAKAWRDSFAAWSPFLDLPQDLRKMVYTTNAVEALNRQVRKVIKNRGSFPTDQAAEKLIYLAVKNAEGSFMRNALGWRRYFQQFTAHFGERMPPASDVFGL